MLYQIHEWQSLALMPARLLAGATHELLHSPFSPLTYTPIGGPLGAACELFELATRQHHKPEFGFETDASSGTNSLIKETVLCCKPFCRLVHFSRERAQPVPSVLLVAPLSGHFAAQLRELVAALLSEHDVCITDWVDAREVPLAAGEFGLDDYIDYLLEFMRLLAPDLDVIAVCQATVPALAAVSLLAADGDPAVPRSMTLFAGLVDTRINPTAIDEMATSHPLRWFEQTQLATVPAQYPGFMRRVHPGFIQRATFMATNVHRLAELHRRLLELRARRDVAAVAAGQRFYDEYLAVMDLPAEFYLQTVKAIFQDHSLPKGEMTWRGRKVEPRAINSTALMTIEAGRDDVSGRGQTDAAHDLCRSIPAQRRWRHVDAAADHLDLFTGATWRHRVFPHVQDFLRAQAA